jgi:prephenate dehydratase
MPSSGILHNYSFYREYSKKVKAALPIVRLDKPKTTVMLEVTDGPGSLQDVLKFFWKHDVNMCRIESRPTKGPAPDYAFYIDFDGRPGDATVDALLDDLKRHCQEVLVLNEKKVPWFPRKISDLDMSVSHVRAL